MLRKIIKDPILYCIYFLGRIIPDNEYWNGFYLKLLYRHNYKQKLNLKKPNNYNEKIQWLKIYDRKDEYTKLVDKYEVKNYIKEKIGKEYVVPLLGVWNRFDEINFDELPNQFVLKCTHDSGGLIVCKDKQKLNLDETKKKIEHCLRRNYYYNNREWPYKNVKPRIIAEEYLKEEQNHFEQKEDVIEYSTERLQSIYGLLDYKFMCFDGKVKALFLDIGVIGNNTGHSEDYFRNVYDREFNKLNCKETREFFPHPIKKPYNYDEMIRVAEQLSNGLKHVRVDLYSINKKIYVGELTFYHGSGLTNFFKPSDWNDKFGKWIKI